jgi:hypothetical protein
VGIFIFCLIVLCGLGWLIFTQLAGRQQLDVHVPDSIDVVRSVVRKSFGPAWSKDVEGKGMDNFRPRLRKGPPVLSVDYEPTEDGGCDVHIWASAWTSMWGLMGHGQLIWRKRLYVARKLNQASTTDLVRGA